MTVSTDLATALVQLDLDIKDVRLALVENGVAAGEGAPTAILGDLIRTLGPAAGPVNAVAPAISPPTVAGTMLTVSTGTWGGSPPITYAYAWYLNSVVVPGQTASTYTTSSGDVGDTVYARVTATNSVGTAFANSNTVTLSASGGYESLSADSTVLDADTTVLTADHEAV